VTDVVSLLNIPVIPTTINRLLQLLIIDVYVPVQHRAY